MSLSTLMQTLVSGVMLGCLYALVALGFAMILGITHSLNLAHGESLCPPSEPPPRTAPAKPALGQCRTG